LSPQLNHDKLKNYLLPFVAVQMAVACSSTSVSNRNVTNTGFLGAEGGGLLLGKAIAYWRVHS